MNRLRDACGPCSGSPVSGQCSSVLDASRPRRTCPAPSKAGGAGRQDLKVTPASKPSQFNSPPTPRKKKTNSWGRWKGDPSEGTYGKCCSGFIGVTPSRKLGWGIFIPRGPLILNLEKKGTRGENGAMGRGAVSWRPSAGHATGGSGQSHSDGWLMAESSCGPYWWGPSLAEPRKAGEPVRAAGLFSGLRRGVGQRAIGVSVAG